LIRSLIETGARSPVDLLDPATSEQASLLEEAQSLGSELRRLADALYPDPQTRHLSRLYPLLSGFTSGG
jgi:hypothetical protein